LVKLTALLQNNACQHIWPSEQRKTQLHSCFIVAAGWFWPAITPGLTTQIDNKRKGTPKMLLGIPKEIMPQENRVAALPENIAKYKTMGFDVIVETNAGAGVFHFDEEYKKAGAQIASDAKTVYDKADIILKVKEPILNEKTGVHEIDMLRKGQFLVTFLHPAAPTNHDMVKKLRDKGVTSFTMDGIPRISRAQQMDALTSMSTITGYKSVVIAANQFSRMIPMIGTSIGVTKPASVLVIGTGVVGLQAIATAKRMGSTVKAVDIRPEARKEAESLGVKNVGFDIPAEVAIGEGGYAKALPSEWIAKERAAIDQAVVEADIIILSALVPSEVAPILITEDMIKRMKAGSVIIDVSIDQGGNCAMTVPGRQTVAHHVHVCGIKNIPGSVPVHSSWMYSHNMYYYIENLFKGGLGSFNIDDEIISHTIVTHAGKIYHKGVLKAMGNS
jgi:NAD(P) transhydrogenase subunit alpha